MHWRGGRAPRRQQAVGGQETNRTKTTPMGSRRRPISPTLFPIVCPCRSRIDGYGRFPIALVGLARRPQSCRSCKALSSRDLFWSPPAAAVIHCTPPCVCQPQRLHAPHARTPTAPALVPPSGSLHRCLRRVCKREAASFARGVGPRGMWWPFVGVFISCHPPFLGGLLLPSLEGGKDEAAHPGGVAKRLGVDAEAKAGGAGGA